MAATRRKFLSLLTKSAAVAAASSIPLVAAGCNEREVRLNAIFHGLFLMDFYMDYVNIYTPIVDEHQYMIGNWDADHMPYLCPTPDNHQYHLLGAKRGFAYPTINDPNLMLSRSDLNLCINTDHSKFCAILPPPEEIHYLRRVEGNNKNEQPTQDYPAVINNLSLCVVLVYIVPDFSRLALKGVKWTPHIDTTTQTCNLHFWAEPINRLTPDHEAKAYEQLSELTKPICIKLNVTQSAPLDLFTGIDGVSREEEQGLSEWSGGGETSYPSNCSVVMAVG